MEIKQTVAFYHSGSSAEVRTRAPMQHDPIRQPSFGALYTVPEDEEESDEEAGSAVRSPVADPGDWRHSFSDARASTWRHSFSDADAAGAESKQDPATGPARASGRCDDSATGSPASSEETPWSAMPWPAGRLAGGFLELRGGSRLLRPDRRSKTALCTIQDGILAFRSDPRSGEDDMVLAAMDVKDIVVTVFRNAPRQFVISSCIDPAFHERTLFRHTRIHCIASSQEARNKWLAVLHRTGVHLHGEMEDGSIRRVRQGVPQAEQ